MTYSPEKYQANKERIAAAKKRYYEKNRVAILTKQKTYDDQHRNQIAEKVVRERLRTGEGSLLSN